MTVDELKEISGWEYLDTEKPSNKNLNEELYSTLKTCEIRRELFEVGLEVANGFGPKDADKIGTMVIVKDKDEFIITLGREEHGLFHYHVSSISDKTWKEILEEIRKKIEEIKIRRQEFDKNFL